MLVIELNKDLTLVGYAGTVFLAELENGDRYRIVSSISDVNGAYLHISHAKVIGNVSTPEDRIIDGIVKIHERWEDEPHDGVAFEADVRDLATRIYRYVKEELVQENMQSG